MGRQSGQKLVFVGNPMENDFFQDCISHSLRIKALQSLGRRLGYTNFEGCSLARRHSVNFLLFHTSSNEPTNFPYLSEARPDLRLTKFYKQMYGKFKKITEANTNLATLLKNQSTIKYLP